MTKSWFILPPRWHIPVVLVLTFWIALPFMDLAMPHASKLRSQERPELAMYFTLLAGAVWFTTLLILLPRRQNTSGIAFIRALGRLPLPLRFLLAYSLPIGLFWLGTLYERMAA